VEEVSESFFETGSPNDEQDEENSEPIPDNTNQQIAIQRLMENHQAADRHSVHKDLAELFSSATALQTLEPGQINDLNNVLIDKIRPNRKGFRVRAEGWQIIRVYTAFQQVIYLDNSNEITGLKAADVTITDIFKDMMIKHYWLESGNLHLKFANGELSVLPQLKPDSGIKRIPQNNGYPLYHSHLHQLLNTDTESHVTYDLSFKMHVMTYFVLLAACEDFGLDYLFNDSECLISYVFLFQCLY
jgi:hypothetical protein